MRDRFQRHAWHLVADGKGVPVGHYKSPSELLAEQLKIVRGFLIKISQQKGVDMATQGKTEQKTERTNMVFLAGELKFDPKVFDENTKCLIDVGQKSSIQCAIYTGDKAPRGNSELAAKMQRFKAGDFIKVVAILRPYGVKQGDNSWKNNMSVDITEIKNDPPQRGSSFRQVSDDDIPF